LKIVYVVTAEILGPQNSGGVQYSTRNITVLRQAFGEDNIYVCAITKHKEYLAKKNANTEIFYSNRSKVSILKNTLQGRLQFDRNVEDSVIEYIATLKCDTVIFDSSRMGYLQERLPKEIPGILFMLNIEKDYIAAFIKTNPIYLVLKRAFELSEAMAVKNADTIVALNNRDALQLDRYYGKKADLILPITMDDIYVKPNDTKLTSSSTKLQLLFVGSRFAANEHSVKWFINKVMPHVDAELTVIGNGFEKLTSKLQRHNVKIIGRVDDLSQYYHEANAIVSPIRVGSGMKVKTTEALMYGKPMFATDEALEGYEVDDIKSIYRCNSAQDFISEISEQSKNESAISFDPNIRQRFLEKYNTVRYISSVKSLIEGQHK